MADPNIRLDGKTVLVTGANTGLGKGTVKDLGKRGARLILACRDVEKAQAVADEVKADSGATCTIQQLDLANLASIRKCAQRILETESALHILVNNAGIMMCPQWKTADGFEMQFGTNHLGHFLFTNLLLDLLKKSAPSRIIILSSMMHSKGKINFEDINSEKKYNSMDAYYQSKLANILFSLELSKRLEGTGVTTYSVHPGAVNTDGGRHLDESVNRVTQRAYNFFGRFLFKTPEQGAQTTIYCAVAPDLANTTAKYYADCREKQPHRRAMDHQTARRLWDLSSELVGLEKTEDIMAPVDIQ